MTLEPKPGGFLVRLRFGRDAEGRPARERFLIATKDETVAADIEIRMTAAAHSLSKLHHPKAKELLTEMGRVAADPKAFRALEGVVSKLAAEAGSVPPAEPASGPLTFRDVAELWCSGALTEQFPDSPLVPPKAARGRQTDRAEVSVFYPALGFKPITELTHEDIDAARRLIPKDLHPNTRRIYLIKLRLVLRIAAGPLRMFATGAPPTIEIPRKKAANLFGYLYPQEEALLLANTRIPLFYRVLYGYLARNGCRIGETTRLTWDHVDIETGDIHIDKKWTKTKRARRWVLDADVLEAFEAFHRISGSPRPSSLVFPGMKGQRILPGTVLFRFRGDLRDSGVTRKTLLEGADGIEPIRVHDLRASFVTLALRAGKTTKWIMTRTGHETLGVLSVYDRLVQDANEHHLPAWFAPMAQAIPELRPKRARATTGPSLGQGAKSSQEMGPSARSAWTHEPEQSEQIPAEKPPSVSSETPLPPTSGPAENKGVGQTGQSGPGQGEVTPEPTEDTPERALVRIEEGLQRDLSVALEKGWLEIAGKILGELSERRRARSAPSVTSLSDARRKKDEGK